ncbi:unnamed protein product [Cuscuta epithymum]|uniref:Peptidase A1 domain-containing protein n=1 Tax=Cuscuta epithymum TaxID=186058 RepID=A0AAV0EJ12_9ASTE|nr:unnamed protein product [Cuscuta epithymum]
MSKLYIFIILTIFTPTLLLISVKLNSSSVKEFLEYNIYQQHSNEVNIVLLGGKGLPKKGTVEYNSAAWTAVEQYGRRHLSTAHHSPALTFAAAGDVNTKIRSLGNLHFAQISVGTPPDSFMVAIDTGSDISWLPCGCKNCPAYFLTDNEDVKFLNSYDPKNSSTSAIISCESPECWPKNQCPAQSRKACPYEVTYGSSNTTSTKGILVKDVLHLETYDHKRQPRTAPIIFGCGMIETGENLEEGAINGLLGLGFNTPLDVPGRLASKGLVPNSFSLCFGLDGKGRLAFGDKGSSDQMKTPIEQGSPGYYIRIERIGVDKIGTNVDFVALVDSGTSITQLNHEEYTILTKNFDSLVKDTRVALTDQPRFQYCYTPSTNHTTHRTPSLTLKMKGGAYFDVITPIVITTLPMGEPVYCLGIVENQNIDVNVIGQNFMTGYRLVFDREKSIFGWKQSNCIAKEANTIATSEASSATMGGIVVILLVSFSVTHI